MIPTVPTVSKLCHSFLGIYATQIDNVHVLYMTGRICSPLRNHNSTESINNQISIVENYSIFHKGTAVLNQLKILATFSLVESMKMEFDLWRKNENMRLAASRIHIE